MRLKPLEDFLAIVQHGGIRAAARQLGVSQPAITRSLRRLETDLGTQVLERTQRGILLTPEGRKFFGRVRVAHAELQKAHEEMATARNGVSVSFGVGPTVASLVVPRAVSGFRSHHPGSRVRILEGLTQHLVPLVMDGSLDFAVGARPQRAAHPALTLKPLFTQELVVAVRKGHPLRGKRSLRELAGADWASCIPAPHDRSPLERMFAAAGLPAPSNAIQCESYQLLVALVAETSALGILTRKLMGISPANERLEVIHIEETLPSYPIYLITRSGIPLHAPASTLAKAIAVAARKLAAADR